MKVQKFKVSDADFERSPGQDGEIFAANMVDQRNGGPVTIGYGRYGPNQTLTERILVHDTMVVLEGRLSVTAAEVTVTAGPGEVIHMPEGQTVTITSHDQGALTAYVTYPHWQEAGPLDALVLRLPATGITLAHQPGRGVELIAKKVRVRHQFTDG